MSYVDGVLCAVPTANKQAYLKHAKITAEAFKRHGALSVRECWGVDVPDGETNSLNTAVLRKPDETVVLSWVVWPSREARDAAWEKLPLDSAFEGAGMPFDGQRMIFGGFETLLDV